jgi:plastocyanin
MRPMTIALALTFAAGSVAAFATERTIMQKNKTFSESELELKKGDSLVFVNDVVVVHNIMSTTAGSEFNLGSQSPGASTSVTMKSAGDVTVMCAIHPRMKLTVKVKD